MNSKISILKIAWYSTSYGSYHFRKLLDSHACDMRLNATTILWRLTVSTLRFVQWNRVFINSEKITNNFCAFKTKIVLFYFTTFEIPSIAMRVPCVWRRRSSWSVCLVSCVLYYGLVLVALFGLCLSIFGTLWIAMSVPCVWTQRPSCSVWLFPPYVLSNGIDCLLILKK